MRSRPSRSWILFLVPHNIGFWGAPPVEWVRVYAPTMIVQLKNPLAFLHWVVFEKLRDFRGQISEVVVECEFYNSLLLDSVVGYSRDFKDVTPQLLSQV